MRLAYASNWIKTEILWGGAWQCEEMREGGAFAYDNVGTQALVGFVGKSRFGETQKNKNPHKTPIEQGGVGFYLPPSRYEAKFYSPMFESLERQGRGGKICR